MDIDWIRGLCLSLPGATEQILWGNDLVFKVGGKMFAAAPLEPGRICLSFKCSDEDFAELIEHPGIIPAPYAARAHWVALESDSALRRTEIEHFLRQAHTLIVGKLSKKLQSEILASKPRTKKRRSPKPRSG
jgi:predicted DNA-binding protein (MmcQ/YjbR family)